MIRNSDEGAPSVDEGVVPDADQGAQSWEDALSERIGKAVQRRRKALGLTALALSERTKGLDYPIHRVPITKIENNKRAGKFDVAELLVLAVALEIPPALLLFPGFPDGEVEAAPDRPASVKTAREWLCGDVPLPEPTKAPGGLTGNRPGRSNHGVALIRAIADLAQLDAKIGDLTRQVFADESTRDDQKGPLLRAAQAMQDQIPVMESRIADAKSALWGSAEDGAQDG